ncbi:MAG: hypothetical protein ABJC39_06275 [Chloroflexota bacterium]
MSREPSVDERISAWLLEEAPDQLPARVLAATFERTRAKRQGRPLLGWTSVSMFRTTTALFAAGAATVLIVVAANLLPRANPSIAGPSPTAGASSSASPPAVVGPSATPKAEVSTSPVAQSLKLTWSKVALDGHSPTVAWLGDRFVLVDRQSGGVRTSPDGASWHLLQPGDPDPGYAELLRGSFATWQNDVIGWWNPEDGPDYTNKPPVTARDILRIVRPSAAPTVTTPFKGRIGSIGIGPAGIVAFVASHVDFDAWVASKLGANWVSHYTGVDFDGVTLRIGMDNGPGLKVVWADEGFEPGDYLYTGFGWYSPDGEQWTAIPPDLPPSPDGGAKFAAGFGGDVVGVSDGFIARGDTPEDTCPLSGGCGEMWHSADGVIWRNLGKPAGDSSDGSVLLPWMGGALVTDGVGRFDFWTSQGHTELPMAAEVRTALKQPTPGIPNGIGTGPLGLVRVLKDDKAIFVTRDGIDWDIQPMTAAMAADQTSFYGTPDVVVGDRSVLVVLWSGTSEAPIPSLWRGTLEP